MSIRCSLAGGLVWFGLVWFGSVWFGSVGLVWCGLVWLVWLVWFGSVGFGSVRFGLVWFQSPIWSAHLRGLGRFSHLSLLKWPRNNLGGLITGPFQLYFGSRSDPVAAIATSFKKPNDIYKTCVWVDFYTFDWLNGRETIWEASKRALFSTILAPDQIWFLRLQRPSKNLKTYVRPVFGKIFTPLTA